MTESLEPEQKRRGQKPVKQQRTAPPQEHAGEQSALTWQSELRTAIREEIREPLRIVGELQYAIQQLEEKTRLLLLAANRRGEAGERPLFASTEDALEETAPLATDASEEQKRYVGNRIPHTGAPVPHLVGEYPRRPGEVHREY